MARLFLSLLTAVALLVASPAISAARADCAGAMAASAAISQASQPCETAGHAAASPCRHPGSRACEKACAAIAALGVVPVASLTGAPRFETAMLVRPATSLFLPSRDPGGFDPPPR